MTMDLAAFQAAVDDWAPRINAEHFAFATGRAEQLSLGPIYADHAEWFTVDRVRAWDREWDHAPREERHAFRRGLQWSLQGYLSRSVEGLTRELAEREAALTVEWEDETLSAFVGQVRIAQEPDAMRRRGLYERVQGALDSLDPLREERLQMLHATAVAAGFPSYLDAHQRALGLQYSTLFRRLQALLRETEESYIQDLGTFLEAYAGTTLADAHRADAPYLRNLSLSRDVFTIDRLRDALNTTVTALGLQPLDTLPITMDLDERARKHPRAFCVGIHIPNDVRLSHVPRGGIADYQTTFHEMGHALHFAHSAEALGPEDRYIGDRALSETYAFLLQGLIEDGEWLSEVMGIDDPQPIVSHARLVKTYLVRRYVAKLGYEIQLHGKTFAGDLAEVRDVYADSLTNATAFLSDARPALWDLDDGLYAADYLRAWCLDAQIRRRFIEQYGRRWWHSPEVHELLRYWWSAGRGWTADELASAAGVGAIKSDALVAELCA